MERLHGTRASAGAAAVEKGHAHTLCGRTGVKYVNHIGAVALYVAQQTAKRLGTEVCKTCAESWPGCPQLPTEEAA